jgi:hypothetical protein
MAVFFAALAVLMSQTEYSSRCTIDLPCPPYFQQDFSVLATGVAVAILGLIAIGIVIRYSGRTTRPQPRT